jgi:hypothetical protein
MSLTVHAKDVPNLRGRLARYLATDVCNQIWGQMLRLGQFYTGHLPDEITVADATERLRSDEISRLRSAELFYVSSQMTELVVRAGQQLPEFRLAREDLPSDAGFLYWDGTVGSRVERDLHVRIVAVSWGLTPDALVTTASGRHRGPGVWLSFWSDPSSAEAAIFQEAGESAAHERKKAREMLGPLTYEREVLVPFMPDGDVWGPFLEGAEGAADAVKALLTTWLLMGQTITAVTPVRPSKRDRGLLERHGDPTDPVRYVALRRAAQGAGGRDNQDEEGSGSRGPRKVQHQFPVSGHWRRQWYRSEDRHRPLWIDPYWKGPEGAPVLHTERVFTLRR